MKIVHLHSNGAYDATADITVDPERLATLTTEVPERMLAAVVARWDAVREGVCCCSAGRVILTRRMKRDKALWGKGNYPNFDGYLMHAPKCPAMDERARAWIYEHLRNLR